MTRQFRAFVDKWPQVGLGAVDQVMNLGILAQKNGATGDNGRRSVIATHGVNAKDGARCTCVTWFCRTGHAGQTRSGLGCVFVQLDLVDHRYDFAVCVVAAGRADVMRALQLTAVRAFVRIRCRKRIVRAAVVAARLRYFVLLDSHGLNLSSCWADTHGVRGALRIIWAQIFAKRPV